MATQLSCQKHEKEIIYICSLNEWHVEPLCVDCVPEHS